MYHMKKKEFLLNMITEISGFILDGNPSRMDISLFHEPDGLHISITDNVKRTDDEIEDIYISLNKTKRPELAGYYGSMTGHDLLGKSRLDLLGWQIKRGNARRFGDGIKIEIWIGNESYDVKS